MNKERLEDLIRKDSKRIYGIRVMQNGEEVYTYTQPGLKKECHLVASVSKSILSILIGIALDKGYIQSLDQKVLDFFPEYTCPPSEFMKKTITIKDMLTMAVPYPFIAWREPLDRFCRQKDWVATTLDILGTNGQTGEFKYATFGVHLLSALLTRATQMSAREFANENLFLPLELDPLPDNPQDKFNLEELFKTTNRGLVHDRQGISACGWGFCLNIHDLTRIGELYLNQGIWNGKQIISSEYVNLSTTPKYENKVFEDFNYGYLFWLANYNNHNAYMAVGQGGNTICCVPDLNTVITITSTITMKGVDFASIIKAIL